MAHSSIAASMVSFQQVPPSIVRVVVATSIVISGLRRILQILDVFFAISSVSSHNSCGE